MKKTLLTLIGTLLLSANLSAQELPKVKPEDMCFAMFGSHPEGNCITLCYDTDKDGREDTRFHYMVRPLSSGAVQTRLMGYAVDEDRDGYFTEDEWFPSVQEEENGGIELQEPGNRREVDY